jgi:hypothetical protein
MIGYYDEFRISIVDRTVYNYSANTFHHNSFKLHEWSGRDYLTWFPGQRPFSFNQDLFDKYIPEAVRNRDTNMVQWVMKAVGLTNEYIYWTQTKTTGGHLESLSTFWGLLADRIADARDRVIVDQDVDTVSHRHISQLAKLIGYEDVVPILNPITTDELSMDKFRKAVKKLALLWKRKGTLHGLRQFMRMYDIALDIDVTYYRRFWDSVVDPLRSDIPLDSTPMDTYFSTQPIGEIGIRAYYMARNIDMDSNGVTGAAGTSTFTSAGATWLTNATIVSPGDMLSVQDYTAINNPANGEYRVLTVPLGTQVTVDHSWTAAQGGLNNIIFQLWKYLPVEDPAAEFTMNMLRLLIPYNMILVYNDPT